MKAPDSLIGAVLLGIALVVLWHVSSFPPVPGQPYGSALFPTLAAGGLAVASFILMLQGLLKARTGIASTAETNPAPTASGSQAPGLSDAGDNATGGLLPVVIVLTTMGLYIAFVDSLGFIICGALLLIVLMALFRVRPWLIVPMALLATLIIHTGFYRFLRVPLPWGILQPIAW